MKTLAILASLALLVNSQLKAAYASFPLLHPSSQLVLALVLAIALLGLLKEQFEAPSY